MIDWKNIAITKNQSLKEAMELLDKSALRVVLVVDEQNYLQGVITDGDIRRGLLKGLQISAPVEKVMKTSPIVAYPHMTREYIRNLMLKTKLLAVPVVDQSNHVLGIETIDTVNEPLVGECDIVLMAGGFGKRLYPLTQDVPKPMLRVGNKPILESILESFVEQGFRNFYISTHYRADLISQHFGNGAAFGCNITYLQEQSPLGTAGALSLVPAEISDHFIVMNADIITKINLHNLLNFHTSHEAMATMCIRQVEYNMPYGVVEVDYPAIKRIKEKPTYQYFINAGIYAFSKKVKQYIEKDKPLDMPSLYESLINQQQNVIAFPLYEYWIDIGRHEDYQKVTEAELL